MYFSQDTTVFKTFGITLTTLLGFIPAFLYFFPTKNNCSEKNLNLISAWILNRSFLALGIASEHPQVYYLNNDELQSAVKNNLIPINQKQEESIKQLASFEQKKEFQAYVNFKFGNIIVLCNEYRSPHTYTSEFRDSCIDCKDSDVRRIRTREGLNK